MTGASNSEARKRHAEQQAWNVPGVHVGGCNPGCVDDEHLLLADHLDDQGRLVFSDHVARRDREVLGAALILLSEAQAIHRDQAVTLDEIRRLAADWADLGDAPNPDAYLRGFAAGMSNAAGAILARLPEEAP
jgi:hypothetical protein